MRGTEGIGERGDDSEIKSEPLFPEARRLIEYSLAKDCSLLFGFA